MKKRWYQFATVDERWTFVTWIVFLGVTGIFFAGFWFVAGTPWLSFLKTAFGASIEVATQGAGDSAHVVYWIGTLALLVPIIFSTIPALAVLLGISNWLTRKEPQDDAER